LIALLLCCRWFRLGRTNQVTVDDHVVLDDALASENDVPRSEDAGPAADLVASFL
jgi:hypothetical protein